MRSECFVKAVELKSLTAAGKDLKLPKSDIRSKIKNLEGRELHDLPDGRLFVGRDAGGDRAWR
jgi:hypothetical protein